MAIAIDPVRVGAASWTNDLVLRRSWTRRPAASVAKSAMGTMSVDFMVMGRLSVLQEIEPLLLGSSISGGFLLICVGLCS